MSDGTSSNTTSALRYLNPVNLFGFPFCRGALLLSRRALLVILALCCCIRIGSAQAATSAEAERDRDETAQLKIKSPAAADLLERGELLLSSGRAPEAAVLLSQASELVPNSAVVARSQCEALTTLRQPEAAVKACRRALVTAPTQRDWPRDMLAMVRAHLAAEHGPTPEQLREAVRATQALMHKVPNQSWPYRAQCEIAKRLGQVSAQTQCNNETVSAQVELSGTRGSFMAHRPRWYIWAAWLALGAAGVVTLLHAVRSAFFKLPRRAVIHSTQVVLLASCFFAPAVVMGQSNDNRPGSGSQGPPSGDFASDKINEKDPESSVPSPQQRDADPLGYAYFVMGLTDRADRAMKHQDYKAAARYYKALVKAAPNHSVGYAKLCTAFEAMEDWPNALDSCSTGSWPRGRQGPGLCQIRPSGAGTHAKVQADGY